MSGAIVNSSQSSLQDEIKDDLNNLEQQVSTINKRKRWLIIGGIVLLLSAVISIAIAVPVSITRKNSENNANIAAAINTQQVQQQIAVTTTSIIQQAELNHKINGASLIAADQNNIQPPIYAHQVSPFSNLTRLKIYTPVPDARIFVMGDIHGCLNEMNALLKLIEFQANKDVLILTGDLVFRGPDSIGVIRRAKELNALCVRGNHDDKVVRLRSYENQFGIDAMSETGEIMPEGDVADPLKFGNKHLDIARNMNVDDYNYLAGCPLILDIPQLNARVVHGGLDPHVENLTDNDPWSVMNMRDMDAERQPSKLKLSKNDPDSDHVHWTTEYQENAINKNITIYYGHDASRGVQLGTQTIGVDSGCIYGRKLSAIDIKTHKMYQVDCLGEDGDDAEN